MIQWLIAFVGAFFISVVAYKLRLLTRSGAFAAGVVGFTIYGTGGWKAAVPLLVFFTTSNLLGRLRAKRKSESRRAVQVFSNGGIAAACCVWAFIGQNWHAMGAFIGAFAAANADTWATEIGTWLGGTPFSIVTGQKIEPGDSGGVTIAGWIGSLLGGLVIGLCALLWSGGPLVVWFGLLGWAASLFDSYLGAMFQAKYLCADCGQAIESRAH